MRELEDPSASICVRSLRSLSSFLLALSLLIVAVLALSLVTTFGTPALTSAVLLASAATWRTP